MCGVRTVMCGVRTLYGLSFDPSRFCRRANLAWQGSASLPAAAVAAAAAAADVPWHRGAGPRRRVNAPRRRAPHGHGAGASITPHERFLRVACQTCMPT